MHGDLDSDMQHALQSEDHETVIRLYTQAADAAEAADNPNEACFYLTQAWITALHNDLPEHESLHERLAARGRL